MIPKATKPREVICFFPADLSPNDDGSIMTYLAYDCFSDFVFNLGVTENDTELNILTAIKTLVNDKNFNKYNHSFTLVLHKYQHLEREIDSIISPHKGSFVVDDQYVAENMLPLLKMMFEHLSKNS